MNGFEVPTTDSKEVLQRELNAEQKKQTPSFSSARGGAKEREETRSSRMATATRTGNGGGDTETRGVALSSGGRTTGWKEYGYIGYEDSSGAEQNRTERASE